MDMELFLSKLQTMMNVLYYYYYLFYTKIIPDNEPHATTIFTLGFTISLIINGLLDILLTLFFDLISEMWIKVLIFIASIIILYFAFGKSGKGKIIVEKEKPMIRNNQTVSIIYTVFIFVLGLFFLFVTPLITKPI